MTWWGCCSRDKTVRRLVKLERGKVMMTKTYCSMCETMIRTCKNIRVAVWVITKTYVTYKMTVLNNDQDLYDLWECCTKQWPRPMYVNLWECCAKQWPRNTAQRLRQWWETSEMLYQTVTRHTAQRLRQWWELQERLQIAIENKTAC